MSVSVKMVDHSKEVLAELDKKIETMLNEIGGKAEAHAKEECPVDTGMLRNSINNKTVTGEKANYVRAGTEYAIYVEMKDNVSHTTGKAHFIRDSLAKHTDEYKEIVIKVLKS